MTRLIDTVHAETEGLHAGADAEALRLLGRVSPADYWRFLARTYAFVCPVERAIAAAPEIERVIDVRRFRKHELLRRDLLAFGMAPEQVEQLRQCRIPAFETAATALGWAFVIERGTLGHYTLFRHLATVLPGEVAFTSSYLKCYGGAVAEMWQAFGDALDGVAPDAGTTKRVVDAAHAAFRMHRACAENSDGHEPSSSDSGQQHLA